MFEIIPFDFESSTLNNFNEGLTLIHNHYLNEQNKVRLFILKNSNRNWIEISKHLDNIYFSFKGDLAKLFLNTNQQNRSPQFVIKEYHNISKKFKDATEDVFLELTADIDN